jgi:hypothetical protein
MKKIVFCLCLSFVWIACDKVIDTVPDEQKVPDAVVQAIAGNFTGVEGLSLTALQNRSLYFADFYAQMTHYQAIVAKDGVVKSLQIERPITDLPVNAQSYFSNQYPAAAIEFLFEQVVPTSKAFLSFFVQIDDNGQKNLFTFDGLGARIGQRLSPASNWWRYPLDVDLELPANIRSAIEAVQPGVLFQEASMYFENDQMTRWHVVAQNGPYLNTYLLDEQAQILSNISEDLLALDAPNRTIIELDVSSLPTDISNYLDAHFDGWQYQRGVFLLDDTTPFGFSVLIYLNQVVYYTRFGISGNFLGATRGE